MSPHLSNRLDNGEFLSGDTLQECTQYRVSDLVSSRTESSIRERHTLDGIVTLAKADGCSSTGHEPAPL
ncbi:hypothetical protein [Arachnia propionica]|uniref:hypothetical protein n=1 Tax=Arachnia propionica TaxID=1750 RepID=UPI001639B2C4|nr:hypothetical protein [Arachnia propionica]